ncbi:MAG: hypothetical protein A2Y62_10655 [Candidatus Fischerbacteria bacterium RBG_13_37_8]|uniref:non-specific serine/threonine protein kinase n=1 Tax=Candidatus Fischerbacteria bacterium RBG_13_37_8 TaxID=1817863 RepID=A0A1F5VUS8_9BACT|nr:MAG: hypothetical protein A2Y62_10655 [Candidatus Fischerbacteria bacterium RBG_13_37_8]
MGSVYKVFDTEIEEHLALKFLNPEIAANEDKIARFRNELKYARKISHRNVCKMYDLGKSEGIYYISMEYVPGINLKHFIQKHGQLPVDKTINIARQICAGLDEAHRLNIIHRDLKPQNIMIEEQLNAKIMDFGLSRSLDAKGVTQTGLIMGTPDYIAPEQAEGIETDGRADIYSLGVILFEMVTGQVPFEGTTALSIIVKHKTEPPPDPQIFNASLSQEMSAVILKCMAKDRQQRYQSAGELLVELNNIQGGMGITPVPVMPRIPAFLSEHSVIEPESPVFVARQQELIRLNTFLDRAHSEKGQVICVTGEAGSGKSALLQEFSRKAQLEHPDLIVATGKCSAHTGIGDPYLPFIELLSLLTGDVEAKAGAGIISAEHAVRLWNIAPHAAKAIVNHGTDLINIFVPGQALLSRAEAFSPVHTDCFASLRKIVERKSSLPSDSTLQQSSLFEQYTRMLRVLSRQQPLLLILDDVQWIDTGSANLLFHLGRAIAGDRIMIVCAYRPSEIALGRGDERHPIETIIHEFKRVYGDIEIQLGKEEGRLFIDVFLDVEPNHLGKKFRDMFYKQTDGHPLFTVELLRDMQERGALIKDETGCWQEAPGLNWDAVPARVDAVIEERIGRLNENLREMLTIASVEGEEFTAEVIARLQDAEVRELIKLLSGELDKRHHLVFAKGIRQIATHRLSLYFFQHILFQRHLYATLDDVERAHFHEQVGHALESLYGEHIEEISVQLARHFYEAGITHKAIEYLSKAGKRAIQMSASEEAITHLSKTLALLKSLPENAERDQQELATLLALIVPLQACKGFGAPDLGTAVVRARELCDKMQDAPQLFTALAQLATYYSTCAQYRTSIEINEKLLIIAAQLNDPLLEAIYHYMQLWPTLNVGELVQSWEHAKHMIAFYDQTKHGFLAYLYGYDFGVLSMGFGSWALWLLGHPEQALQLCNDGLLLARKLGHPHTLAFILLCCCELYWFLKDYQKVAEYNDELEPLCSKNGFLYFEAHAIFYNGERKALEGKTAEGIEQMRRGLAIMEGTGTLTCFSRLLARLADACLQKGEIDEGLKAVEEAFGIIQKFDERYMEAELYRLKGELLRMQNESDETIAQCFLRAIEIAHSQQAKSWEDRASASLNRLRKNQGTSEE